MAIDEVLATGLCVGCGVCAAHAPQNFEMKINLYGRLEASRIKIHSAEIDKSVSLVCPFSGIGKDESDLARELFPNSSHSHELLGLYESIYAGHVETSEFRSLGSSGGMGSWILSEALQRRMVDGVIHVRPATALREDGRIFEYRISRTIDEIASGAKSKYYPVELSAVLTEALAFPGKLAVIGVPCFLKAIRRLADQRPIFRSKLGLVVGLLCGQLKGTTFGSLLAWQCGIEPAAITGLDFRVKQIGKPANQYAMAATGRKTGTTAEASVTLPMASLYGADWGYGFFKYKACDYCDDVFAETADIVIGDAWLPEFDHDWRGTNVVIARLPAMSQLIAQGIESGQLALNHLDPNSAIRTQDASIRHRRDELPYRLSLAKRRNEWFPAKRCQPDRTALDFGRKAIQRLRSRIRDVSDKAFLAAVRKNDLGSFFRALGPYVFAYRIIRKFFVVQAGKRP